MAGIYIHIPYCKTRCVYCDFFTQTDNSSQSSYIDALVREIKLRKDYIGKESIKSIYFGGGTPSQLTIKEIVNILDAIYSTFRIAENIEITLEANPDDLNKSYIHSLSNTPINRLSVGIQSFNDKELHFLNRRHSAQNAKDAIIKLKDSGFANISVDLMYGLPHQTIEIWKENLEEAVNLDIQHISSYHLIYEQGTRLYKLKEQNKIIPVAEDISLEMFSLMIDKLTDAGFEHYEISNFARQSLYAQHNSSYWLGDTYLGVGAAAHSFDGEDRAWNISSIQKYIEGIDNERPAIEIEKSDKKSKYNDFILTGMRTKWGISIAKLDEMFGKELLLYCMTNIQKHIDNNSVINENDTLKLTRKGIFVSDDIMSDLMYID